MSEPVGNAPRDMGIPGNSHKEREVAPKTKIPAKSDEEREPIEKIVTGKAVKTKAPWFKRVSRGLIADDATSIGDFLVTDVLLPAVRNLLADLIKGGTDRVLYGQSRARRGSGRDGDPRSLRTRYDRISEGEPRRMLSREDRARHSFDSVVLSSRDEAISVVEALIERVERYRMASVADLYDLVGVTGSYADRNHGWTDLRDADIRQTRDGWLLDLPRTEPLR